VLRKIIQALNKIYPLLLCLACAVLLALPFFDGNLWPLSWIGFLPLFLLLEDKNPIKAFGWCYLFGLIFFISVLYWLIHVTMLGWIILSIILALYFGLFGSVVSLSKKIKDVYLVLFFPCSWVCLEFLRGSLFTGFPWALMGYSQYKNLLIIQIADITGVYGISFLVLLTNFVIYKLIKNNNSSFKYMIWTIIIILLVSGYGYFKLNQKYKEKKFRVSVIQGNIPQEKKWQYQLRASILDKHLILSRQAAADNPDIIIWPETSVPGELEQEPLLYNDIFSLAKQLKADLLVGTVTSKEGDFYNSAVLISKYGLIKNRYDKLHLVPFGEYIPFPNIFGFVADIAPAAIGNFEFGKDYVIFSLDKEKQITFSVLICFEDVFGYLARNSVRKGAKFLVNITNDAWFKKTVEPYQHLQSSVFRAIENRVWVVRAANTGVSCFISPRGEVVATVKDETTGDEVFISGYKTHNISLEDKQSLYSRFGDLFVMCCFVFCLTSIFFKRR
jgi:apolipoprotein N-acyltransferase